MWTQRMRLRASLLKGKELTRPLDIQWSYLVIYIVSARLAIQKIDVPLGAGLQVMEYRTKQRQISNLTTDHLPTVRFPAILGSSTRIQSDGSRAEQGHIHELGRYRISESQPTSLDHCYRPLLSAAAADNHRVPISGRVSSVADQAWRVRQPSTSFTLTTFARKL